MNRKMLPLLIWIAALSLAFVPNGAEAALNAYFTMTGETQGRVEGGVTQAGREGTMEIYGFSHEVTSPRDAATGLPTGKRQHKPIVVTKPVDKASPIIMRLLTTNENITEWRLDFYQPDRTGREVNYYSIELTNARVVGVRTEMEDNRFPDNVRLVIVEKVEFVYESIRWTHQDGGVTAEDDWETPVVGYGPRQDSGDRVAAATPVRRSVWAERARREWAMRPQERAAEWRDA